MPIKLSALIANPRILNQLAPPNPAVQRTTEGYRTSADGNWIKVAGEWEHSPNFYEKRGTLIEEGRIAEIENEWLVKR